MSSQAHVILVPEEKPGFPARAFNVTPMSVVVSATRLSFGEKVRVEMFGLRINGVVAFVSATPPCAVIALDSNLNARRVLSERAPSIFALTGPVTADLTPTLAVDDTEPDPTAPVAPISAPIGAPIVTAIPEATTAVESVSRLPELIDGKEIRFASREDVRRELDRSIRRGTIVVRGKPLALGTMLSLVLSIPGEKAINVRAEVAFNGKDRLALLVLEPGDLAARIAALITT